MTITNQKNNKFCPVPWNELHTTSQYQYLACCKWLDTSDNNVYTTSPAIEHYNSKQMKDFRLRMIAGDKLPECQGCWTDEDNGNISPRMRRNLHYYGKHDVRFDDSAVESVVKNTAVDGSYNLDNMHALQINTGDKCQLRCIDCSTAYSRSIKKDYEKLGWKDDFKSRRLIASDLGDRSTVEKLHWKHLKENTNDQLKIIRVSGGEPSIDKYFIDYLNYCVDIGISKNVEILLHTNGVNLKKEFLEPLTHFSKVTFNISVDGVGKLDEYLRYPTNWDKKLKNIQTAVKLFPHCGFNTIAYSLNVLALDEVCYWAKEFAVDHHIEMLNYPDELNVVHLPQELKTKAIDKLETLLKTYNESDRIAINVNAVINRLKQNGNSSQWEKSRNIIQSYNTIRKHSLESIIPEFKGFV